MRKTLLGAWTAVLLCGAAPIHAQNLTGDVRLACEAILCLSSPARPSACAASLARYFAISFRLFTDTVRGRINFLKLCPVSGADEVSMNALVTAIGNGAGFCDADSLNRSLASTVDVKECPVPEWPPRADGCTVWRRSIVSDMPGDPMTADVLLCDGRQTYLNEDSGCRSMSLTVVSHDLPAYCASFVNNPMTYGLGLRYDGAPLAGGRWTSER